MQLLLIRHSITAGNLEHRYIGCRTDESLWHSRNRWNFAGRFRHRNWCWSARCSVAGRRQRSCFPICRRKSYGDYRSAISERSKEKIIRSCPVTRPIRRGSTAAVRWHFRRANPERNLCGDAVRRWKRHCKAGRNLISQQ